MATSSGSTDRGQAPEGHGRFDAWAITTLVVFVLLIVARVLVQV